MINHENRNASSENNTVTEVQKQDPENTRNPIFFLFSVILQLGFLLLIFFLLADTDNDRFRTACKGSLWGLVLARTIFALLEWGVQSITAIDSSKKLDLWLLLYKFPFAIAFTVFLPEAVDGGVCVKVSQSSNALVVISWIYLVVDWISSVAGLILLCCGSTRRQKH
jgi:hypothetical protein